MPYRRPTPKPEPVVHIQDERFPSRALCGITWLALRGGRIASDTSPPVVVDEAGSANVATCKTCLAMWQRRLAGRP